MNREEIKKQYSEFVKQKIKEALPRIIEDDWYSFSETIDINIWSIEDGDGKMFACAYDVIDGKTQTDHWTEIEVIK